MRPPNRELVEHFRSHLLPPAVDTPGSKRSSLARLGAAIYREAEQKDSYFFECCRSLIAVVLVRLSLPASLKGRLGEVKADLSKALQAADLPAIAEFAEKLGVCVGSVRLDSLEVCESLLDPRPTSGNAVERAMAPARTLLVAMLRCPEKSKEETVTVVARLFDLLGLGETRDLRRAAEPHLLDAARRVSMTLWTADDYRMIEACAVAMATLQFEKPPTQLPMPQLKDNTLDWGDGTVRLQRTQLRLAKLLLEHPFGVTPKQLKVGGIESPWSPASRLRGKLESASCPWTVLHTGGKYKLVSVSR